MTTPGLKTHARIISGPSGGSSASEVPKAGDVEPLTTTWHFEALDAGRLWSVIWAVLPPPRRLRSGRTVSGLEAVNLKTWPDEYIQIAGRDDRFTVEVREASTDGFRQLVLGRSADQPDELAAEPTEVVPWGEWSVTIYPHEVWTAEQARVVFRHWYLHDELPSDVTQREIQL